MQLGTAARQHHAVAEDVAGQLRRGLFQHLMGRRADLLAQHHDRLIQVAGGDVHPDGQAGQQAAALDLHRLVEVGLLGAAGHILFQLLSGALTDGDAELVAHMLQDLVVVVVARHADAGGLDLAAQAQHCDVRGAAADVDDHPAVGLGDVDAGAESCGDGLINEVDLTRTGCHDRLDHGVALDAGDGRRHTDRHAGLDHVGAVHLIDEPADELAGHGVVADDAVLQREDRGNIVRGAAHHGQRLIADLQHRVLAGIHRHHAGLIEHHAGALLRDDDGRGTKVDTDIILCHNTKILSLLSLFLSECRAPRPGNQTHYSIT